MKIVAYVIAFVLVVIIGFFGVGLMLPGETHVERSIEIDAPPALVFSYTADHKEFQRWSPWTALDPNIKVKYSGPEQGVGSVMRWKGNQEVGEGASTFIEYQPNERATVELDFGEMGGGTSSYILKETDSGTHITWTFDTKHQNFIENYIGLFLDGILGPEYEKGLKALKELVEAAPSYKSQEVSYSVEGTEFTGYLAYPAGLVDPVPGILVVHEWWGHNDYARKRADELAALGYVAFALDMYGDGKVASHPADAGAFMQEVGTNTETTEKRFDKAFEILMADPRTNPGKIGAIGYCFGGSVVINMARSGKPLVGVVSFHGGLGNLMDISENASAHVLVLNGAADPFIKQEHIDAFEQSMKDAEYPYEFINYEGAKHAFTNPDATKMGQKFKIPLEYNEEADKKSWEEMKGFFNKLF